MITKFIIEGVTMETREWANLQESLLKSQLWVIREFLRIRGRIQVQTTKKSKSQIHITYNVLHSAKKPLHVTDIIARAKQDFSVTLDRESIVSSITKKIKSGRMFKRVAPNTFTLLNEPKENTS